MRQTQGESTGNTRYFKHRVEMKGYPVVVINTMKFKVITESVKKTDTHDAATIAEFLSKDILPEANLCSETSEQLRRLLKVRSTLVRAPDDTGHLAGAGSGLVVQPLFETIDRLTENVKTIEVEIEKLMVNDKMVELLETIPGCGSITAWAIRAYMDEIGRFSSYKKYASYAGLAPWVQCSNQTEHYGRITKRGSEELRTALVQVVIGMRRSRRTPSWRLMEGYESMKRMKGTGKTIIATARKLSKIVWSMLTRGEEFNVGLMTDRKLESVSKSMRTTATELST